MEEKKDEEVIIKNQRRATRNARLLDDFHALVLFLACLHECYTVAQVQVLKIYVFFGGYEEGEGVETEYEGQLMKQWFNVVFHFIRSYKIFKNTPLVSGRTDFMKFRGLQVNLCRF